ncbi:DUF3040 domain-containing protein [Nocardioides sp. AX2bis]|uniref:DUF3040 domain-containing protein n=1 Tax=Nocardioides sp. AX2bis TaxID=2653157 RepID=UPI0012EF1F9C|nr:DUF3040 domain-containing protein [Nocardioides sp. AX2bis]VXB15375.1 conserved hypothetical protein [Nocardioides sp. AX2bis]
MPLSEEELRLLEQMERALVEEDPKFASTLRGTSMRRTARRRALLAAVVFVVGVVVLMTGAITNQVVIGIVGFVVMLGSATLALTSLRGQQQVRVPDDASGAMPGAGSPGFAVIDGGRSSKPRKTRGRTSGSGKGGGARPSGSFMERMEQRWRRRREGNGF